MSAAIVLEGISKAYRDGGQWHTVLDRVDLRIGQGEHVAIMGASGSGKSTLLAILGCLDTADSGSYHCLGQDVSQLTASRLAAFRNQNIGFVFQNLSLLPRMSVLENVALPLAYAGVQRPDALERAHRCLELLGMQERAGNQPRQLSGGQQQRVAIARALVMQPRLLLADEPTGALDRDTADQVNGILAGLKSPERTLIVVTHDIEVARRADRILPFVAGGLAA